MGLRMRYSVFTSRFLAFVRCENKNLVYRGMSDWSVQDPQSFLILTSTLTSTDHLGGNSPP